MRRHDDPIITCPYDSSHKMPSARLQWHYAKCKAKQLRIEQGLPIYNCKFNYSHIFLEKELIDHHEEVCPDKQKISRQLEIEEKLRLNKTEPAISNFLEEMSDGSSESQKNDLLSTTDEPQLVDKCGGEFESSPNKEPDLEEFMNELEKRRARTLCYFVIGLASSFGLLLIAYASCGTYSATIPDLWLQKVRPVG